MYWGKGLQKDDRVAISKAEGSDRVPAPIVIRVPLFLLTEERGDPVPQPNHRTALGA